MRLPTFQEIRRDEREMEVYNLPLDGNYLIVGPPGSGKTVMALYRAERLNEQGVNHRLVLAVFNQTLNRYVSDATGSLNIQGITSTWHSWFWTFHRRVTRDTVPTVDGNTYICDWPKVNRTLSAAACRPHRLDQLIIDEAQDLSPYFFALLPRITLNSTVFADMNQQLKPEENATLEDIREFLPPGFEERRLTKNYRNTREIASVAARFYVGLETGIPELPSRSGPIPVAIRCASTHDAVEAVARYARNHADESIAVVTHTHYQRQRYVNRLRARFANRVQTYGGSKDADFLDFSGNRVTVLCLKSIKGLEFDAVFLVLGYNSDTLNEIERMELYVATSRPREHLAFLYEDAFRPAWMTKYLTGVVEFVEGGGGPREKVF